MAQDLIRRNQGGGLAPWGQHPLSLFRREMDSLFSRFFGGGWLSPFEEDFGSMRGWGFDVEETDKETVIRADVPGFEESELDVRLENNVLTIKAEKEQKGDGREYRRYFRQFTLPQGIDAERSHASYRNGVLELRLPRSAGSQARRIPIQGTQAGGERPGTNGGDAARAGEPVSPSAKKK